jgi:hypothetical protein
MIAALLAIHRNLKCCEHGLCPIGGHQSFD